MRWSARSASRLSLGLHITKRAAALGQAIENGARVVAVDHVLVVGGVAHALEREDDGSLRVRQSAGESAIRIDGDDQRLVCHRSTDASSMLHGSECSNEGVRRSSKPAAATSDTDE